MDAYNMRLTDKVCVVTGSGAGIGRGIATGFAACGGRVALFERNAATAASVSREIRAAGGDAMEVVVDVREGEAVGEAVEATLARFGRIDVLVNNAGGVFAAPFLETREKGWDAMHRANLKHIYHCTQRVAHQMVEQGQGGSIINVVSIEGVRAAPLYATYAAAKAGAINFTKTLALELAPHGIRVNAIAPDICITEGLRELMSDEALDRARFTVPLGRLGEPSDIAGVAVFLASPLAAYLTGETLHVDGGTHAAGGWYQYPDFGQWAYGAPAPANSSGKGE